MTFQILVRNSNSHFKFCTNAETLQSMEIALMCSDLYTVEFKLKGHDII